MISKLDADQFEAERANAAAKAAEFERQKVQKENQLSVLLGRNPGGSRGHSLTDQVMPPEVPPGLPSELFNGVRIFCRPNKIWPLPRPESEWPRQTGFPN